VRGAFIGLEHATDRAAATRAVLEGVTFACATAAMRWRRPARGSTA
jgi:sugar (pentulose or hexulose) kinase